MFSAKSFSGLRNPFSSEFWTALQEMSAIVAELATLQPEIAAAVKEKKRRPRVEWFPAAINNGAPVPTSRAAWTYEFAEVKIGPIASAAVSLNSVQNGADFEALTGGRTGEAINVAESANTNVLAYGYNVTSPGPPWYLSDAGFTACEFMPVPPGTVVFMREVLTSAGLLRYEFWAPNPIIPACEEV